MNPNDDCNEFPESLKTDPAPAPQDPDRFDQLDEHMRRIMSAISGVADSVMRVESRLAEFADREGARVRVIERRVEQCESRLDARSIGHG
jgi:hypothetical protein